MAIDPKKVYFVPYGPSEGLALLAKRLGLKRIKTDGTSKVLSNARGKLLICWGLPPNNIRDDVHYCEAGKWNHPVCVRNSVNKIDFFRKCAGFNWCLEWTTDPGEAFEWVEDGGKVIARTTATGTGGEGITVIRNEEDWDTKKKYVLFTKYVPKKAEYRVHVVNNEVIAVSRKVLRKGEEPKAQGWEVRSHDNGFIFQREDIKDVPKEVLKAAKEATICIDLDFAGVDVLWNEKRKQAYVCEVNSAPGIEGDTVEQYALAFEKALDAYKL